MGNVPKFLDDGEAVNSGIEGGVSVGDAEAETVAGDSVAVASAGEAAVGDDESFTEVDGSGVITCTLKEQADVKRSRSTISFCFTILYST